MSDSLFETTKDENNHLFLPSFPPPPPPPQPPPPPPPFPLLPQLPPLICPSEQLFIDVQDVNRSKEDLFCLVTTEVTSVVRNVIDEEIKRLCFNLNINDRNRKLSYIPMLPYRQIGPTCGLAIICMFAKTYCKYLPLSYLLTDAKSCGFTHQGEMFSVKNMKTLCDKYFNEFGYRVDHKTDGLEDVNEVINVIKNQKAVLFVPYDADYNNEPCLRNGVRSHWGLIFGIIESEDTIYVLARQGKSSHIEIWKYEDLKLSNANLHQVDPVRCNDKYVIPQGGVQDGLCRQYLVIKKDQIDDSVTL